MKKIILITLAALAAHSSALAQELPAGATEKIGDVVESANSAFMLVRIFDTPEINASFQRNVNIMRHHAKILHALREKLAGETNEEEKKKLEDKIKQVEDEFKANDQLMRQAYAFAIDRTYRQVFLKSVICEPLTDEEMADLKDSAGNELDPLRIVKKDGKNHYRLRDISGVNENENLQRLLGFVLGRKSELDALRQSLADTTDPQLQLSITEKIAAAEKALLQCDEDIKKAYSLTEGKSYTVEIEVSKLYLQLTREEILKLEAQRQIDGQKTAQTN